MNKLYSVFLEIGDGHIEYQVIVDTSNDKAGFDKIECLLGALTRKNNTVRIVSDKTTISLKGK